MAQKVAEYELYKRIKLLGEGAFGKAYLVEFLQDNSVWVIKYMDMNTMSPSEKDETLREAKILELLQHPNIVKFKEVYKTKKGKLCIVMEYADGQDIAKRIKDARGHFFSENQILDWFTQICLAIKHVHDRKIIHRDLKGQNIFLMKDNRVKLGDFGIARVLKKTIEKAKTMVGTPYYISPEIVEGRPYSFMTDIWSIGVVLYEMCALKPPFNAESLHFLALKIVKGQYAPIPNHYSKDLKNLVGLLLQVEPRRRPTIQEILKLPVVVNRIKGFLSESIRHQEFSHTILHRQVFEPKTNMAQIKVINKELPCPPDLLKQNIKDLEENLPSVKPYQNQQQQQQPQQQQPKVQQNLVALKSQPSQFESKPQIVQNQVKSQPSQFSEQNQPPTVQPPNLRPPVLQQALKPPIIISPDQSKEVFQKVESKDQLMKNNNKPSSGQPQRPQSNNVNPGVVKSPQMQPKQLVKGPISVPAPSNKLLPRPQSSNQQLKQVESKEQIKVVPKEVIVKQRPASEYRLNDQKKNQEDKNRIDDRIKNLKINEQKQKDQLQIDLQRKASAKEQQRKDEIRREELRQEEIKKKRNEQVSKRDEDQQKMKDDIKKKLEQQWKEPVVVVIQQQNKEVDKPRNNGKKQPKHSNSNPILGEQKSLEVRPNTQEINEKMQEKNKEFEQMLMELEAVIQIVNKLPDQVENNYFDLQTQLIQKQQIPIEDRDDDDEEPDLIDPDVHEQKKRKQEDEQKINKMSKEEVECLNVINNNNNKDSNISTLRISLEKILGVEKFDKAITILKNLIDNSSLDEIEKKYGKSYDELLPFLSDRERRKYIPLLITHVVTNSGYPF